MLCLNFCQFDTLRTQILARVNVDIHLKHNYVGKVQCLTIVQKHQHTEETWRVRVAYGAQRG